MRKSLLVLLLLLSCNYYYSVAQDIRGGEIHYSSLGSNMYQFNIYLFTQTSIGIDHSNETFYVCGGGTLTLAGTAFISGRDITMWHYNWTFIYPGSGSYELCLADSFRISGIQNITNSSGEGITLSATLEINPNIFPNNTPVLMSTQEMVDVGGGYISHNPMAYDPDGDSLVFSLVPATSSNYTPPPGITIDPSSGYVQMPVASGKWAINIEIDEWRRIATVYHKIATTYREMILDSSSAVGISEIERNEKLCLYPNPVSNNKEIIFTCPASGINREIVIHDITGKQLARYSLPANSSSLQIKLPALAAGLYVARLVGSGAEGMVKFIIE